MTSPSWWTSFPERPDLDDDREPDEPIDEPGDDELPEVDEEEDEKDDYFGEYRPCPGASFSFISRSL